MTVDVNGEKRSGVAYLLNEPIIALLSSVRAHFKLGGGVGGGVKGTLWIN